MFGSLVLENSIQSLPVTTLGATVQLTLNCPPRATALALGVSM
jgi:hypothetical protein